MSQKFKVEKDFHNTRFDKWFKITIINLPQSLIEKIIRKNKVKVNKKKIKTSYRVQQDDIVEVFDISKFKATKKVQSQKYKPTQKELGKYNSLIIEENDNFIVINKPAGIAVQSGTKSFKNIIDILKDSKVFEKTKPYIVHRLDKETSGILLIAKNREYAQLLTSLFRIRKIHKTYVAITYGQVPNNLKIMRDNLVTFEKDRKVVQKAISNIKVIKKNNNFSFIELNPITGRKHQLRKQLYNIGCPIVGDTKYYLSKHLPNSKIKDLMLHSYKIKFIVKNIKYNFKARYNQNFEKFLSVNI